MVTSDPSLMTQAADIAATVFSAGKSVM